MSAGCAPHEVAARSQRRPRLTCDAPDAAARTFTSNVWPPSRPSTAPLSLPAGPRPSTRSSPRSSSAVALARGGRLRRPVLRVPRGRRLRLRRGHPEERLAGRLDGPGRARAEGGRHRLRLRGAARLGRDEARRRHGRADRERAAGRPTPVVAQAVELPRRYELEQVTLDVPGIDKRALLERAAAAAHAYDPHVLKVEASFAEEIREILVVTSDGRMARDVAAARALRRAGHRRARRQAAGGVERRRRAHEHRATSRARAPSGTRERRRGRPS